MLLEQKFAVLGRLEYGVQLLEVFEIDLVKG